MNQDEIIEMAKQAGLLNMDYELGQWEIHEFTTFAKLIAAKEGEKMLFLSKKAKDVDGNCDIVLAADIRGDKA